LRQRGMQGPPQGHGDGCGRQAGRYRLNLDRLRPADADLEPSLLDLQLAEIGLLHKAGERADVIEIHSESAFTSEWAPPGPRGAAHSGVGTAGVKLALVIVAAIVALVDHDHDHESAPVSR